MHHFGGEQFFVQCVYKQQQHRRRQKLNHSENLLWVQTVIVLKLTNQQTIID